MSPDKNSLAHTPWNCTYHIVIAPQIPEVNNSRKDKTRYRGLLRQLCERKCVEIIEATNCVDHIHMLLSIPPKISVSSFVGYQKGKSNLMIFDRHSNLNVEMDIANSGAHDIMLIR